MAYRTSPVRSLLLASLVLILLMTMLVPPCAARGLSAKVLGQVVLTVQKQYVDQVTLDHLIKGAVSGMSKYLQEHGVASPVIKPIDSGQRDNQKLYSLIDLYGSLVERYKPDATQLLYAGIRGAVASLNDPYSEFMTPQQYNDLQSMLDDPKFGGVGIYIELDAKNDNWLTVVEAMDGTPAAQKGLRSGDVITHINGKSTKGTRIEDAQNALRGQVGTSVVVTIRRKGASAPFNVTLVRAIIAPKTVSYRIIQNDIGYIKLSMFGKNTGREVKEAMQDFSRRGVDGYLLDLRNNGGGYVEAAIDLLSCFLKPGSPVVSLVTRDQRRQGYSSRSNPFPRLPLVVLVNEYSASASEITAGAIQDLKVGTLLGTKTFGKGCVQDVFQLEDNSAVKLTIAYYATPAGRYIHKKGIVPDVRVEMDPHEVGRDDDKQMAAAIARLKKDIARQPGGIARQGTPPAGPVINGPTQPVITTPSGPPIYSPPGPPIVDSPPLTDPTINAPLLPTPEPVDTPPGSTTAPGAQPGSASPPDAENAPATQGAPLRVDDQKQEYEYVRSQRCPVDGGGYHIIRQVVFSREGRYYDRVDVSCQTCNVKRSFYFEIGLPLR